MPQLLDDRDRTVLGQAIPAPQLQLFCEIGLTVQSSVFVFTQFCIGHVHILMKISAHWVKARHQAIALHLQ